MFWLSFFSFGERKTYKLKRSPGISNFTAYFEQNVKINADPNEKPQTQIEGQKVQGHILTKEDMNHMFKNQIGKNHTLILLNETNQTEEKLPESIKPGNNSKNQAPVDENHQESEDNNENKIIENKEKNPDKQNLGKNSNREERENELHQKDEKLNKNYRIIPDKQEHSELEKGEKVDKGKDEPKEHLENEGEKGKPTENGQIQKTIKQQYNKNGVDVGAIEPAGIEQKQSDGGSIMTTMFLFLLFCVGVFGAANFLKKKGPAQDPEEHQAFLGGKKRENRPDFVPKIKDRI